MHSCSNVDHMGQQMVYSGLRGRTDHFGKIQFLQRGSFCVFVQMQLVRCIQGKDFSLAILTCVQRSVVQYLQD